METVITLLDIGESPDDVDTHHVGSGVHIYVKNKHVASIHGVHKLIRREKNYVGKFTDIVVDNEDKEKREVIATLLHKRTLANMEEIEATRPVCNDCGARTELIGGSVFAYIYRCPNCGKEITE